MNVCPCKDTVLIHQKRLEQVLEIHKNEFHVSKQQLYGGHKHHCFILMIRGGTDDYNDINNKLLELHADEQLEYFPWNEYIGLNRLQNMTLINDQNEFTAKYRSLLITGFADDADNIPMVFIDVPGQVSHQLPTNDTITASVEETKDDPMQNLPNPMKTDRSFRLSSQSYLYGKRGDHFSYVYPPILGTREVIVLHEHASEATSFIKHCHGALAKIMNEAAILSVFKNPETAKAMALKPAWKTFQKAREVPEAITTRQKDNQSSAKRGSNTTDLTAASKQKTSAWTSIVTYTASNASSHTNTALTSQKTDDWEIVLQENTDHLTIAETENQALKANEESIRTANKRRTPDMTCEARQTNM